MLDWYVEDFVDFHKECKDLLNEISKSHDFDYDKVHDFMYRLAKNQVKISDFMATQAGVGGELQ